MGNAYFFGGAGLDGYSDPGLFQGKESQRWVFARGFSSSLLTMDNPLLVYYFYWASCGEGEMIFNSKSIIGF